LYVVIRGVIHLIKQVWFRLTCIIYTYVLTRFEFDTYLELIFLYDLWIRDEPNTKLIDKN